MPHQVSFDASIMADLRYSSWLLGGFAACAAACGGFEPPPPPEAPDVHASPLMVRADPSGHEFNGSVFVRLRPMTDDAVQIFYTTDGTPATSAAARPYTGALELDGTTLLNFIARDVGGAWSAPGSELYTLAAEEAALQEVKRGLRADPGLVFFAWKAGDPSPMRQEVVVTAFGEEPVTIDSVRLVRNPSGQFFWEAGAFDLSWPGTRTTLQPGESTSIEVSYMPTATFRSAAIELRSNEDQRGGKLLIEVWGRTSAW